jgi:hypothetical protein
LLPESYAIEEFHAAVETLAPKAADPRHQIPDIPPQEILPILHDIVQLLHVADGWMTAKSMWHTLKQNRPYLLGKHVRNLLHNWLKGSIAEQNIKLDDSWRLPRPS